MLTVQNFLLMSIICQKKYGIIFWEQILWIIFSFFSFVDLRWAQLYVILVLSWFCVYPRIGLSLKSAIIFIRFKCNHCHVMSVPQPVTQSVMFLRLSWCDPGMWISHNLYKRVFFMCLKYHWPLNALGPLCLWQCFKNEIFWLMGILKMIKIMKEPSLLLLIICSRTLCTLHLMARV